RRRHTRSLRDWSSDVCSSDLAFGVDDLFSAGQRIIRSDGDKLSVRNRNPALEGFLRCHHPTVFHNKICCHDPPEKPCHLLDDSTLSYLNTSFFNQYVSNMRWVASASLVLVSAKESIAS